MPRLDGISPDSSADSGYLPLGDKTLSEATKQTILKAAAGAFLFLFLILCTTSSTADLDMWHEMALIRESIKAGRVLTADVFAYTPTVNPAVDHEWGAGAILYALGIGLGAWAVVLFKFLIAIATAAIVIRVLASRGADYAVAAALAPIAMLLFAPGWATLRAQAYSFLFLALLLYFLELDRRGKRYWIYLWLPVFVLWVNLHGGCIVGIIVLGLYWLEETARRRSRVYALIAMLLSVGGLVLNPFGLAYYRHLWNTLNMPRPELREWGPVWNFSNFFLVLYALAAAIGAYAVVHAMRARSVSASARIAMPSGVLLLCAMAGAGALYVRMLPMFAIVWICYVPDYLRSTPLAPVIGSAFRKSERITAGYLAATILTLGLLLSMKFWQLQVPESDYPAGAVQYLDTLNFQGNVMTPFNQGAYVSWRLYPRVKVSMDSRYDIAYPRQAVIENMQFCAGANGWQSVLERYPTDLVLVAQGAPVARSMPAVGWALVYRDRYFELYARPGLHLPFTDASSQVFEDQFP